MSSSREPSQSRACRTGGRGEARVCSSAIRNRSGKDFRWHRAVCRTKRTRSAAACCSVPQCPSHPLASALGIATTDLMTQPVSSLLEALKKLQEPPGRQPTLPEPAPTLPASCRAPDALVPAGPPANRSAVRSTTVVDRRPDPLVADRSEEGVPARISSSLPSSSPIRVTPSRPTPLRSPRRTGGPFRARCVTKPASLTGRRSRVAWWRSGECSRSWRR